MPENFSAGYFSNVLLPAVIRVLLMADRKEIPIRKLNLLIAAADFCKVPSAFTKLKLKNAIIYYEMYCSRKNVQVA